MNDIELMEKLTPDIVLSDFGPRLVVKNWDTECASQMLVGKGFPIRQHRSFDSKQQKYIDGIHSKLFGSSWEDEDAFRDRYSCKCGHLTGTIYEGEICPECGTKVGFVDVDLEKFGWIQLNTKFKIINPAMFVLLQKFIGKNTLDRIIKFTKELDINGHFIEEHDSKNKYASIGLTGFASKLVEIVEYYKEKNKNKHEEYYWEIIKKWDCILASNIPVYSSTLRPIFTSPALYKYTKAEQHYNVIIGCVNKLNNYTGDLDESNLEAVNTLLYNIQTKILEIDDLIFKSLDKKSGLIHESIFGGRMDFSARQVIVPNPTLRANEIILSYLSIVELYKLELINLMVHHYGCTYTNALKYWFDAHLKFDNFVYQVMMYMMKNTKEGLVCLINRNPENNWGICK